jgi:hypothetical protein
VDGNSNSGSSSSNSNSGNGMAVKSFQSQLNYMRKEDVQLLRKERDHLMDKMGDMEAEVLANRIRESQLHEQMKELQQTKADLEEQLKSALSQKYELSRYRDTNLIIDDGENNSQNNKNNNINDNKSNNISNECRPDLVISSPLARNVTSSAATANNNTFQPIPIKPQLNQLKSTDDASSDTANASSSASSSAKQLKDELNTLGRLDGLLSNPSSKLNKVRVPDSKKIAAILLETNIVELQRHLLTITVQNQVSFFLLSISICVAILS